MGRTLPLAQMRGPKSEPHGERAACGTALLAVSGLRWDPLEAELPGGRVVTGESPGEPRITPETGGTA